MVKVFAPALSLDASGTIGNAITFSKWKGRHYVRERIIPSNPKSGLQVGFRAMFKFLSQNWAAMTDPDKATYNDLADTLAISNFNAYMRLNQKLWRNYKPPTMATPATEAGTVAAWNGGTPAATGGVSSVTLDFTPATINDNWGLAIFRSDTTGFTPGLSNCIACVLCNAAAAFAYVDSPLVADTWYYDTRRFTDDGVWGTLDGEINGTST